MSSSSLLLLAGCFSNASPLGDKWFTNVIQLHARAVKELPFARQ